MSTIAVNAITDANGGATTTINSVTPNANNLVGKNRIINGNFAIAQRNTSFTTDNVYTLDRWFSSDGTGGSPARTLSQETFTLGQTDVPNAYYYARHNQTGASTNGNSSLVQKIEDVTQFDGQTVTLSFYAKADAAMDIDIRFIQDFGTGGSPSTDVTVTETVSISTSWTKYTVTKTLGSLSGKTLGTDGVHTTFLEVNIKFQPITTFTFDIAQVQLELGNAATEFEHRPYTTELQLCQRYCPAWAAVGVNNNFPFFGQAYGAGNAVYMVTYPVKPRVAATGVTTIGTFAPSASNYTIGGNFSSISIYGPNLDMFGLNCGGGSGIVAGNATAFVSTSATGLIIATGCEL